MRHQFIIAGRKLEYETDNTGLMVHSRLVTRRFRWDDVLAAGISPKRPIALPSNFPRGILPGLGIFAARAEELTQTTELLWILTEGFGRTGRVVVFNIPKHGAERDALISELRTSLNNRWMDQRVDLLEIRKRFGISNWWVHVAVLIGMALALGVLAGWLYIQSLYVASVLLLVIGIIFWLYHHHWNRRSK